MSKIPLIGDGIMGYGRMKHWVNVKFLLTEKFIKSVSSIFLLKSIFQYSTIPLFHVRGKNSGLEKDLYSQ
jgi:hypothetical protein